RHTRFSRDWSSDVCSSDLINYAYSLMKTTLYKLLLTCLILLGGMEMSLKAVDYYFYVQLTDKNQSPYSLDSAQAFLSPRALERRSEERRVGNECRARWPRD